VLINEPWGRPITRRELFVAARKTGIVGPRCSCRRSYGVQRLLSRWLPTRRTRPASSSDGTPPSCRPYEIRGSARHDRQSPGRVPHARVRCLGSVRPGGCGDTPGRGTAATAQGANPGQQEQGNQLRVPDSTISPSWPLPFAALLAVVFQVMLNRPGLTLSLRASSRDRGSGDPDVPGSGRWVDPPGRFRSPGSFLAGPSKCVRR
jgi:hypothetical protein